MTADTQFGESTDGRSRRRRVLVILLIAGLLVFFALWYARAYSGDTRSNSVDPTTTTKSSCASTPSAVEVNVYNATTRQGLAAEVAEELDKRGFTVKTVANDPKKATVTGRGELRHGTKGAPGATLLARHTGSMTDTPDTRTRSTIDVVLGPDYDRLIPEASVKPC